MNILLSFLQAQIQHPIPAYSFWEYNIKNGIEECGHTWVEHPNLDWAEGLTYASKSEQEVWKNRVWDEFLIWLKQTLKTQKIDFFLSYLYPQQIKREAIEEIQKLGIPCVNFFCDNVREFVNVPKEFKVFNLNWVPEYKAFLLYQKERVSCINAPMPMWVKQELRNTHIDERYSVSFIGSRDIQRVRLLGGALQKGLKLEIRGSGWNNEEISKKKHTNQTVLQKASNQLDFIKKHGLYGYYRKWEDKKFIYPDQKFWEDSIREKPDFSAYIDITRSSQVTLGINRYPSFKFPLSKPDTYSRLRDIEAPMLGACYLTEWTEGLDLMYDIGKEIEVYHNDDELIEKTNFLIENKARRKLLREKAQKKALDKLSITHTINKIIKSL